MQIRTNTFKAKIQQGQQAFGIWHAIPHPYVAEICAGAGFDWVCIDAEHAPFDLSDMVNHLRAIQAHDTAAMVRIPTADPVIIKQLLDAGAQNILCPMVEDADQARLIAQAMRYPPTGTRGVGTGQARAAQWNRVQDYFKWADGQMCCLVQVESVKGVLALDEILTVEGVDVVFIGPADLAASMGYVGNPAHPKVVETVKGCIQKIVEAGKVGGFLAGSPDLIRTYMDAGALMIGLGLDTTLLAQATQNLLAAFKQGIDHPSSNTVY